MQNTKTTTINEVASREKEGAVIYEARSIGNGVLETSKFGRQTLPNNLKTVKIEEIYFSDESRPDILEIRAAIFGANKHSETQFASLCTHLRNDQMEFRGQKWMVRIAGKRIPASNPCIATFITLSARKLHFDMLPNGWIRDSPFYLIFDKFIMIKRGDNAYNIGLYDVEANKMSSTSLLDRALNAAVTEEFFWCHEDPMQPGSYVEFLREDNIRLNDDYLCKKDFTILPKNSSRDSDCVVHLGSMMMYAGKNVVSVTRKCRNNSQAVISQNEIKSLIDRSRSKAVETESEGEDEALFLGYDFEWTDYGDALTQEDHDYGSNHEEEIRRMEKNLNKNLAAKLPENKGIQVDAQKVREKIRLPSEKVGISVTNRDESSLCVADNIKIELATKKIAQLQKDNSVDSVVYGCLSDTSYLTAHDIAKYLGYSKSQVNSCLYKLETLGITEKGSDGCGMGWRKLI